MKRISLVLLALLAFPATSQAKVTFKLNPKKPIVDDSVTVSWKTDRSLKPGYHYEASIITPSGDGCASFATKVSKRHPKKGKPMSFTFSSYDDKLNGGSEWCQGKASILVDIAKDGEGFDAPVTDDEADTNTKTGNPLGIVSFRFYAKP